jgi:hypothetical protein
MNAFFARGALLPGGWIRGIRWNQPRPNFAAGQSRQESHETTKKNATVDRAYYFFLSGSDPAGCAVEPLGWQAAGRNPTHQTKKNAVVDPAHSFFPSRSDPAACAVEPFGLRAGARVT